MMPRPNRSPPILGLAGDPAVFVTGDRDLLFDAIANLVDNAIKHGRPGGRVTVTCDSRGGRRR